MIQNSKKKPRKKKPFKPIEDEDHLEAEAENDINITEKVRYSNFEFNQSLLAEAFANHVRDNQKKPTVKELCQATNLSHNTIRNHLKILEKTEMSEKWASFRILTERVILSQARNAISRGQGSVQSAKLFLELVEGWSPGMKLEITNTFNHAGMSNEELLTKYEENGKLINSKLLRFVRMGSNPGRKGSD